jgi:uncharacterized protein YjbI with pentapeptide repeats
MSLDALPPRPKESIPFLGDAPFAAASFPWQLAPPTDARVVVVKQTLAIVPNGVATPLADQDPPCGDVFHDDDPSASLRYASDFAPFKPRADVILVGHAYAQKAGGRAASVRTASVLLSFGRDLRRSLAAIGDRQWQIDGPTDPAPFTRIPLRWERAFGGPADATNPHGTGSAGAVLPNLEQPDAMIKSPGDRPAPACFAPLSATLPARARKLGTYDASWLRERWPYFPKDVDWSYWNAAPAPQQIPYPLGNEAFSLGGVHPEMAVVNGRLPGIAPRVFAIVPSRREPVREIPVQLDTVWIDADAMRVALVWRGRLDVSAEHAPEVAALFFTVAEPPGTLDAFTVEQRFTARVLELHPNAAAEVGASAAGAAGAVTATPPSARPDAAEATREPAAPVDAPPAMTRDEAAARIASGASLEGADLHGADLSGLDLRARKLTAAILTGARLVGARLEGADLSGAVLARAICDGAVLRNADLRGANLVDASLTDADLSDATLDDASLVDADLSRTNLTGARLARANLVDARLDGAKLDGVSAIAADLSGASLSGASLRGATLDDAQMYGAHADGVTFDGASMARFRADEAELAGASFAEVQAASSSFEAAVLRGASFRDAVLDGSVFCQADLERAVLSRASAKGARFRHARMARVSALRANLMEANFESADLSHADLRGANLHCAETLKAKLDGASLDQAIVTGSKLAG